MTQSFTSPWTVSKIAAFLKAPRHCVEYVIRTRNIQPVDKAGNAKVYTIDQVERILAELQRIERDRQGGVL